MGPPPLSILPNKSGVAMVPPSLLPIKKKKEKERKRRKKDDPFFSPSLLSPPVRLLL